MPKSYMFKISVEELPDNTKDVKHIAHINGVYFTFDPDLIEMVGSPLYLIDKLEKECDRSKRLNNVLNLQLKENKKLREAPFFRRLAWLLLGVD